MIPLMPGEGCFWIMVGVIGLVVWLYIEVNLWADRRKRRIAKRKSERRYK